MTMRRVTQYLASIQSFPDTIILKDMMPSIRGFTMSRKSPRKRLKDVSGHGVGLSEMYYLSELSCRKVVHI